jgi:hypothetical protein
VLQGKDSRRQVAELTATPMLAWLWSQLQAPEAAAQQQRHQRQAQVRISLAC